MGECVYAEMSREGDRISWIRGKEIDTGCNKEEIWGNQLGAVLILKMKHENA